ncbi:short-chain dehydrogenase/reductase SDR [Planoprotostelium fungivorum]|uniref:Short-chain dehydrogenase/reductase SDR n=1 Tax=Planoprotostelium fungivorum TaxID=1890364 RepID=A0A2P6NC77_9EUKA|nr:short-chain dehydrogenase/reductase SDR [Planoprotostelium fungivorum]
MHAVHQLEEDAGAPLIASPLPQTSGLSIARRTSDINLIKMTASASDIAEIIARSIAAIIGVGPGTGRAVSLRFAREGFSVALVGRTASKSKSIEDEIKSIPSFQGKVASFSADVTQESSLRKAFSDIREQLGDPEVLVYNASGFARGGILDLKTADVEGALRSSTLGALISVQEVLPAQVKNKKGTVIFTGATASKKGSAGFAGFAIGKWGLRALAESTAREFGPQGVHVSHVIIDGVIDVENKDIDGRIDPEGIADTYWHLHSQHPSAWTFELELRPYREKW